MKLDDLRAALNAMSEAYAASTAKGAKTKATALNKALAVIGQTSAATLAEHIAEIQASGKPPAKPKTSARSKSGAKTSAQPKSKTPPLDAQAIGLALKDARSNRAQYEAIMARLKAANPTVPQLTIVANSYGATISGRATKENIYKAIEDRFKIWVQSDSNINFLEKITPW